jgi:hypothetical protein
MKIAEPIVANPWRPAVEQDNRWQVKAGQIGCGTTARPRASHGRAAGGSPLSGVAVRFPVQKLHIPQHVSMRLDGSRKLVAKSVFGRQLRQFICSPLSHVALVIFVENIPQCPYALGDPLPKKFLIVLIHCHGKPRNPNTQGRSPGSAGVAVDV